MEESRMTTTEIALQEFLGTDIAQSISAQMGGDYAAKIAWLSGAAHVYRMVADNIDSDHWELLDAIEEEGEIIQDMLEDVFNSEV
jgi:hypothetical protein